MTGNTNRLDMLEQSEAWYLSTDQRERHEYWYKKRCGLQQREHNEHLISRAIELGAINEARTFLPSPLSSTALKFRAIDIAFNPAKILRENHYIFSTLQELQAEEWKIVFRAQRTSRVISAPQQKERKSDFLYFSLLVKLRLRGQRGFIELGEGSVQGLKFNQNGLSSRIRKIVANHRAAKRVRFRDKVPVVLNSGDGAILFHEILGHSLEADHVFHQQSPLTLGDIDKPIVSSCVTLKTRHEQDHFFQAVDCDDEGEDLCPALLIENGVLRNLISDSYYKQRLNLPYSGHARLEDFSKIPIPRMYALYLQPGTFPPEELITSTPYGVYAEEFGQGKVYFHKDFFYFNIREAWLIEKGRLSVPLGSIVVQGSIREVLNSVEMVANDFRFDKGISYCHKNGQTLNVRVGQPSVKIGNLYITREFDD